LQCNHSGHYSTVVCAIFSHVPDGTFSVEKPENNNEPLAERKEFKNQYLGKTSNQQQSVKAAGEILSCHP
jgi:hypothetical protein